MLDVKEIDGILHIEASGKLSGQDYDTFIPLFESVAARHPGTVPMLIALAPDFAGWNLAALWRDLAFDVRHKDQFGRIAVVGDNKWEAWGTKLFNTLFRAEMRFFPAAQRHAADAWVRG